MESKQKRKRGSKKGVCPLPQSSPQIDAPDSVNVPRTVLFQISGLITGRRGCSEKLESRVFVRL